MPNDEILDSESEFEEEVIEEEVPEEKPPSEAKKLDTHIRDAINLLKSPAKELEEGDKPEDNKKQAKGPVLPKGPRDMAGSEPKKLGRPPKETIEPPNALNAEEKTAFKLAPIEVQRGFSRMMEGAQKKNAVIYEQLQQVHAEVAAVQKVVRQYRTKWNMRGLSDDQAVAQLCAVNDYVMEKPDEAIAQLIKTTGANPQRIAAYLSGQTPAPQANGGMDPNNPLHKELHELKLFKEQLMQAAQQAQQQRFDESSTSIAREIRGVMDEVDGTGNYRFPKLHDDTFRNALGSLLDHTKRTNPNLSWADATRRAYWAAEALSGQQINGTPPNLRTSLNANPAQKIKNSAISVRGRGAGAGGDGPLSQIKGEKMEDTIKRAIAFHRGSTY